MKTFGIYFDPKRKFQKFFIVGIDLFALLSGYNRFSVQQKNIGV